MTSLIAQNADSSVAGPIAATPANRLLGAYIAEARYEFLRAIRVPGFAVPFLVLPLALYLFFAVVLFGPIKDPKAAISIFTAFAAFGVMGPGMFGAGVFLATDREGGLLTLKRALPVPPAAYLLAKALVAMLLVSLIVLMLLIAGPLAGHLTLHPGQAVRFAIVSILGTLPFCALGLFIGTCAGAKGAPAFVNLLYLPMIYLSGFFFPLPKTLHLIEFASPAYYLDQLALSALGVPSHGPPILHILVLSAVTLAFGVLAVRRLGRIR